MWWMNVVVQFILYKQMKKKGETVYAGATLLVKRMGQEGKLKTV